MFPTFDQTKACDPPEVRRDKALVGALLRDCEIFANLRLTFFSSSSIEVVTS